MATFEIDWSGKTDVFGTKLIADAQDQAEAEDMALDQVKDENQDVYNIEVEGVRKIK
jgi:hypothetical protein